MLNFNPINLSLVRCVGPTVAIPLDRIDYLPTSGSADGGPCRHAEVERVVMATGMRVFASVPLAHIVRASDFIGKFVHKISVVFAQRQRCTTFKHGKTKFSRRGPLGTAGQPAI